MQHFVLCESRPARGPCQNAVPSGGDAILGSLRFNQRCLRSLRASVVFVFHAPTNKIIFNHTMPQHPCHSRSIVFPTHTKSYPIIQIRGICVPVFKHRRCLRSLRASVLIVFSPTQNQIIPYHKNPRYLRSIVFKQKYFIFNHTLRQHLCYLGSIVFQKLPLSPLLPRN